MRSPRESRPINPTHGQGQKRLSDRDASAQRDRSKSSWMSNSAWNDRLSEDRSVGKNVDSRASPVASQLSPSLLDSSEQNVNTGKSTSHVSRVRSHSNDSRASAKITKVNITNLNYPNHKRNSNVYSNLQRVLQEAEINPTI